MRVSLNETSQGEWQSKNLEYLRFEYDLKPGDVVIDLGAYRGEWAEQIFARYGCKIVCVEPGPWIVGFPYGEVVNKAASTHDGTLKFGGAYYYSSSHEETTHEYPCFDINSPLSQYEEIALVKVNIEGGEYELLNHMVNAGLHKRIRNLQVQFHLIEGQSVQEMYDSIATKLRETHYLNWQYFMCWESWARR